MAKFMMPSNMQPFGMPNIMPQPAPMPPASSGGMSSGSGLPGVDTTDPNNPMSKFASPFNGFLSAIMNFGKPPAQPVNATAGLHDRPADIQSLVSMISEGRAQQNPGGFFGGMFDKKG